MTCVGPDGLIWAGARFSKCPVTVTVRGNISKATFLGTGKQYGNIKLQNFWNLHLEGEQNSFTGPLGNPQETDFRSGKSHPAPVHLYKKYKIEKHRPLLCQKMSDSSKQKRKQTSLFSMKCEFPVLTRKQKGKVFIVGSFLWLFRACQSIASSLRLISQTIKCLLTESGRTGNIWLSVIALGPLRCARSVRHNLDPNTFPFGPPTQSIST